MKNDWLIAKIVVVIIIVSRGYYHLIPFINNDSFPFFHLELSTFWYLPSIILAALVLLSAAILILTKQANAEKLLGIFILIDSVYFMLYSLVTFIPQFSTSWYLLVLCLLVGVLELATGKKTLYKNF